MLPGQGCQIGYYIFYPQPAKPHKGHAVPPGQSVVDGNGIYQAVVLSGVQILSSRQSDLFYSSEFSCFQSLSQDSTSGSAGTQPETLWIKLQLSKAFIGNSQQATIQLNAKNSTGWVKPAGQQMEAITSISGI